MLGILILIVMLLYIRMEYAQYKLDKEKQAHYAKCAKEHSILLSSLKDDEYWDTATKSVQQRD